MVGFGQKILEVAPESVCFNSKRAVQQFSVVQYVEFGKLSKRIGETRLFVEPSTSAAANGHWDVSCWEDLAEQTKSL